MTFNTKEELLAYCKRMNCLAYVAAAIGCYVYGGKVYTPNVYAGCTYLCDLQNFTYRNQLKAREIIAAHN